MLFTSRTESLNLVGKIHRIRVTGVAVFLKSGVKKAYNAKNGTFPVSAFGRQKLTQDKSHNFRMKLGRTSNLMEYVECHK